MLQTQNLKYTYDESPVLKGISVGICEGERVAVMGMNGAGKSTLFLNLNGVLEPEEGEIMLAGEKINRRNIKTLRHRVGFVFQDADSQIIASNVRSEVSFGPMNMGLTRDEVIRRVESAIEYMSLEDMRDRAPQYLSGGEKKRVSIADILAMEPDVLIFDEPMAALDPVNGARVEEVLNRLHEEGKTLLVATHDVDFAYRFADRIIVMCGGEIIADGTPDEIFSMEEILKTAHLKVPAVLTIWRALIKAENHERQPDNRPPRTPEELAGLITEKRILK
ncbi:MAG: energy-coupling factor ABC transporter ATP-binding protein [Lachnospiraceae bacterium]|nr:energy-coupling factor ABC transporter ATP-binding protein [Lachnospiraceae bacterium]